MGYDQPAAVEWVSSEAGEASLALVQEALGRIWTRIRPPADSLFRRLFDTAVAEVAADLLESARREDGSMHLDLEISVWSDRVEAHFSDDARPLARKIVARGLGAAELPAERGRGLQIALVALEELEYETAGGRNRSRLLKQRDGSPTPSLPEA
jgi:hypothetical protein